jgi:hypothetical protein
MNASGVGTRPAAMVVAMAAFLLVFPVSAQQKQKASWKLEPQTFLSIKLGGPITQLSECPKKVRHFQLGDIWEYDSDITTSTCWEAIGAVSQETVPKATDLYRLQHLPGVGFGVATVIDFNIEAIYFHFDNTAGREILQGLREKYGPPSSVAEEPVVTSVGAKHVRTVGLWSGRHVSIEFRSIDKKLDEGAVTAFTSKYALSKAQDERQNVERYKKSF